MSNAKCCLYHPECSRRGSCEFSRIKRCTSRFILAKIKLSNSYSIRILPVGKFRLARFLLTHATHLLTALSKPNSLCVRRSTSKTIDIGAHPRRDSQANRPVRSKINGITVPFLSHAARPRSITDRAFDCESGADRSDQGQMPANHLDEGEIYTATLDTDVSDCSVRSSGFCNLREYGKQGSLTSACHG